MSKYVAAAAGIAITILCLAPVMGESTARADTDIGMDGYLRCIDSAGVTPRQSADDWTDTIHIIEWNLNKGESPAQVTQRLVAEGIKPSDAPAEVRCVMTNIW